MMKVIGLGPKNCSAWHVTNNLGSLIDMLSVVLLGLGEISQGYDYDKKPSEKILTHAQALAADSHFKLLGGVDPCSRIRKKFETKFYCKAFASAEEAAFETEVDVLVIATPTETHWSAFELAIENFSPTPSTFFKYLWISDTSNAGIPPSQGIYFLSDNSVII